MDTSGRIGEMVRKRKKTKDIKPYLPNDIISNVLSRLPAKNVMQCRLVCKTWRDLTLNRDFVNLHFRHSLPMLMIANYMQRSTVKHFFLDKWWEPAKKMLMTHRYSFVFPNFHPEFRVLFSHAGLIVLTKWVVPPVYIILNPINLEKVTIFFSGELGVSVIYGVFFHPSLGEYCTLWRMISHAKQGQPRDIFYKMLNLGSNPILKTISNSSSLIDMRYDRYSLLIDNYLYWMLESEQIYDDRFCGRSDIMQFDIIGEMISVKPCPVPVDTICHTTQTHILNNDGTLCFLVILPSKITIWRLQDHIGQLWKATNYTFSTANFSNLLKPVAVVDGSLALMCHRRLHVCDLKRGTVKCFRNNMYYNQALLLSHQESLTSLRNCQSTIYLDKKGEVDVNKNSWIAGRSDSLGGKPNSMINFEMASTDEE